MIKRIEKIIYAKRKPLSKKMMEDILNLEIHTFLTNHEGTKFLSVDKPIKNKDGSQSFYINFI